MNAYIVAVIFTAAASAFMIAILRGFDADKYRIALIWTAASAIAFLIRADSLAFVLLGAMLVALAPMRPPLRVGIYLAVFLALPHDYTYNIPFPGLNYLINVEFVKLATLTLLAPLLFTTQTALPPALRTVERLLLAFVLLSGIMAIRHLPFTSMLRSTVDQFLLIYIPYVAISRSLKTTDDVEGALRAFFAGLVVLAGVGAISSLRDWNYFTLIGEDWSWISHINRRGGFLRIYATTTAPILALAMSAGIIISFYLKSKSALSILQMAVLVPLFAFVMLVSGSRGGQLAGVLSIAAYFVLPRLAPGLRRLVIPGSVVVVAGALLYVLQGDVVIDDEYGTFQYRAELLRISVEQIAQHPFFGSTDYTRLPAFQVLRQGGGGIVDIVNSYLQVGLRYGLVGLSLFVGAHALAMLYLFRILGLMDDKRVTTPLNRVETKRFTGAIIAIMAGYLVLIFTTSDYGWTSQYGFAMLALTAALAAGVARANVETAPSEAATATVDDPPPADASDEAPPSRKPYGARFVRRL